MWCFSLGSFFGLLGLPNIFRAIRNFEGCICVPVWASNRLERNVLDPEGRAQGNVVEADLLLALDAAKMELRMQAPQLLKAWSSQLDGHWVHCSLPVSCICLAKLPMQITKGHRRGSLVMQFSPERDKQGGNLPIAFEGIS